MSQFQLEIITPDGVAFSWACESLLVRSALGDVEILRGHADYFSAVATGRVRIIADGKRRYAAASGGFISVLEGKVMLAPITFEFSEDIDGERATAAKESADAVIAEAKDERAIELAKAKLTRALVRLDVLSMK